MRNRRDLAKTTRRQRQRENGVATSIYGNMSPFSRCFWRGVVFAKSLYKKTEDEAKSTNTEVSLLSVIYCL